MAFGFLTNDSQSKIEHIDQIMPAAVVQLIEARDTLESDLLVESPRVLPLDLGHEDDLPGSHSAPQKMVFDIIDPPSQ